MKAQKKYEGVYLEDNGTYTVKTTFRTKDKFVKSITKRGFETAKKAYDWKQEQKVYYKSKNKYELDSSKTPIQNLVDEYIRFKYLKFKQRTVDSIKYNLEKYFTSYFANANIDELSTHEVLEYYKYLAELPIKNQSKNITITHVMDALNFFDTMEMIKPETLRKFKKILHKFEQLEQSKCDFLDADEIRSLLNTFNGITIKDKMESLMIHTLIYSGLRKSELLALTFKDIDFVNNTINVDKQLYKSSVDKNKDVIVNYTKTNQNKKVIIPPFLTEMFLEFMQIRNANGNDIIFANANNEYLHNVYPNTVLNRHLKMAGLKQIKVHDLRHTFCTMLYDLGAEEQFVAQQMGHSSPSTSHEVYEHLTKDRIKKNIDIVNNLKV